MKPMRPTYWQEIVRQWILMIPLATAAAGTAAIFVGPDEEWVDFLPPLFFVGALLVTTAMLHQRQMFTLNLRLTEQVQATNSRLDTLHRLALELNKSLELSPVANTVLEYSLRSLSSDAAAMWLKLDLLPPQIRHAAFVECVPLPHTDTNGSGQWCCIAAQGFSSPSQMERLADWDALLERNIWSGDQLSHHVAVSSSGQKSKVSGPMVQTVSAALAQAKQQSNAPDNAVLSRIFGPNEGAAAVPIVWENQVVGSVLLANWNRPLAPDDVVMLQDIALVAGPALQNSLLYGAATAQAEIDGLTNLYNHRMLQERLTQELSRATRALEMTPRTRLSVAIMDVTDFKLFNDTYGHATGDRVLRLIADSLRNTFRTTDFVARYGGDEFVMVLPDTDRVDAETVCRRAQESVKSQPFHAPDGSRVEVRVACGVATFPSDGQSIADLLAKADDRLYQAKGKGQLMLDAPANATNAAQIATPTLLQVNWRGLSVFEALVVAIDKKDRYTRRHTERVWRLTMLLATEMNLSRELAGAAQTAALVHDVGKIVVPDGILRKPGRLSDDEMDVMRQHPVFGAQLVKDVPHLDLVLGGVRHHHERWDGQGYPDALSGEDIPFLGRLLAVADSFVAMTIDRPYRKALTEAQALQEIQNGSGIQFDAQIVAAFASVVRSNAPTQLSPEISVPTN